MTQDTRKDKRAKIVSLNVRYKSATVDEFIENHSHDVSKGGLFIKTPTPFPPGTLIKFEIRIAGDKAVIAGVGRVVWKREAGQAAGERPAGMGVKFIKIDDASRSLIDRVVLEKSDAGRDFDEDQGDGIVIGAEASSPGEPDPRAAAGMGAPRPAGPQAKATMMGLGIVSVAPPPNRAGASATGGGMFPTTDSIGDMPEKKERTVMKQAAELLEEALKEAGGSMDDIGSNPLFRAAPAVGGHRVTSPAPIVEPPHEVPKSTLIGMPAARDAASDRMEAAGKLGNLSPDALKREAGAAAAIAKSVPAEPREAPVARGASSPPPAVEEEKLPTSRQRRTDPPAARRRPASAVVAIEEEPRPAKKSGGALLWVGLLAVVGGGAAYFYREQLMGTSPPPPPVATAAPTVSAPPAIVPPVPSAIAAATATAESALDASVAPTAIDSGSTKDAAVATAASAIAAPVVPAPHPASPAPRPTPRPTASPTAAEGATPTPAPAPKPKPAPKPASTDDDNPY